MAAGLPAEGGVTSSQPSAPIPALRSQIAIAALRWISEAGAS